jgi:hypothetical protein
VSKLIQKQIKMKIFKREANLPGKERILIQARFEINLRAEAS